MHFLFLSAQQAVCNLARARWIRRSVMHVQIKKTLRFGTSTITEPKLYISIHTQDKILDKQNVIILYQEFVVGPL